MKPHIYTYIKNKTWNHILTLLTLNQNILKNEMVKYPTHVIKQKSKKQYHAIYI